MTDRRCSRLAGPDVDCSSKEVEWSDSRNTRLKLLVSRSGRRTWYYRYVFRGIKCAIRIGEFPGITVEAARKQALGYGAMLDQDQDPQHEQMVRRTMPTLSEYALGPYLEYARVHKKTANDDESKLKMWILPKLGQKRLCDISRHDIDMHRTEMSKTHTQGTANRHHALLARMLALAVEWDILKENVATGLKKFKERTDAGLFLSSAEISLLIDGLDREPNRVAATALKTLLFSGLRREEVAQARWEHLDLERSLLYLPHTKAGRTRWVPLNSLALEAIASLPDRDSPWIFPGRDPARPIDNLKKPLDRTLAACGLGPMRVHDLRHCFASSAVSAGVSLAQVQSLLGHQSPTMTLRYAHLASQPLHDATAAVARAMARPADPQP